MKDRFDMDQKVIDAEKAGDYLQSKINRKCDDIEKQNKLNKDRDIALVQLRKDDKLMRQDISTYESHAIRKLDLKGRTDQMLHTIDLRLNRLTEASTAAGPEFTDFLSQLQEKCEKIEKIAREKEHQIHGAGLGDFQLPGLKRKNSDENHQSPGMYAERHNCEQRMETFHKFFME